MTKKKKKIKAEIMERRWERKKEGEEDKGGTEGERGVNKGGGEREWVEGWDDKEQREKKKYEMKEEI